MRRLPRKRVAHRIDRLFAGLLKRSFPLHLSKRATALDNHKAVQLLNQQPDERNRRGQFVFTSKPIIPGRGLVFDDRQRSQRLVTALELGIGVLLVAPPAEPVTGVRAESSPIWTPQPASKTPVNRPENFLTRSAFMFPPRRKFSLLKSSGALLPFFLSRQYLLKTIEFYPIATGT